MFLFFPHSQNCTIKCACLTSHYEGASSAQSKTEATGHVCVCVCVCVEWICWCVWVCVNVWGRTGSGRVGWNSEYGFRNTSRPSGYAAKLNMYVYKNGLKMSFTLGFCDFFFKAVHVVFKFLILLSFSVKFPIFFSFSKLYRVWPCPSNVLYLLVPTLDWILMTVTVSGCLRHHFISD